MKPEQKTKSSKTNTNDTKMNRSNKTPVLFPHTLGRNFLRVFVVFVLMVLLLPVYTYTREHIRTQEAKAAAGINRKINFQGKLVNPDGTNVTDGSYNIKFAIYTVSSGGSDVWNELQSVTLSKGIFQVNLGSVTALPGSVDFNTDNIYLGITVQGDAEMTPRIQFTSVPQAFNAEKLGGLDKSGFIQNSTSLQSASNFYIQSNNASNVTAKFRAISSQTADVIQVRDSGDTTTVFAVSPAGTITAGTWNGTALTDAYVSDTLTASNFVGSGSTSTAIDLGTAEVAGTLGASNGGTGLSSYTTGDLLYASGTTTLAKLASVASGSCLTSQGVGAAPAWSSCVGSEADTLASVTARGATTSSNVTFNGTLNVTSDTTYSFSGTENLTINSDLDAGVNLIQITGTPSATAGTTRGLFIQQANSANTNGLDQGIYVNNADTDLPIGTGLRINNSGGGGFTDYISAPSFTLDGTGTITAGTWNGTALTDAFVSNTLTASILIGSGSTTNAVDLATAEVAGVLGVANGGTGASSLTDLIALGSNTTGNYVAGNTSGTGIAVTGSAGEGWSPTISLDYSSTLAGNPTLTASQSSFASTGLIFEGSSADTNELLLTASNPGSDVTLTLPAVTGTIISTGNITDISGLTDSQISDTLTASNLVGSGSTSNAVDLGTAEVAGTLGAGNGGTGISSYTAGDLLYASGASTLSKLTAVASGSCLISQGVGTAPAWGSCGLASEADTLATVTARGATTSTNVVFNGTLGVTTDTTFTFSGTENIAVSSDLSAGVNLIQVVGTPSATAGTTRGLLVQQANSANTNGLDQGIYVNNADTDLAITTGLQFANSGGGGFTNYISAPSFVLDGTGTITTGTWNGTALTDAYVSDTLTASNFVGSGSTTNNVDLATGEVAGTLGVGNGGTGATSLNNLITLGTHTTGNYVADVAVGTGLAVTGSAGEGWTPSLSLNYAATLAGNPTLSASQSSFASTGLIFEGSTADTNELLLIAADPGSDVTLTLPNFTGTLIGTGNISDITGLVDSQISNTLTASILIGSGSTTNAVDLATAEVNGTLGVGNGGTGITSYTIGDLLYASGTSTLSKLAAVASGSCLTSQGVGTAPAWGSCGLTSEADTLATVTGRGATTSSNLTFNGTLNVTSDTTFNFSGTENLIVNSDLDAGVNLIQVVGTPSATAGATRGLLVQQANSANTNGLDQAIYLNNADTDLPITTGIQFANSGGGGYTNYISAPSFTLDGTGTITAGTWNGTALTDAFVSNTLTASNLIGSGSTTNAVDLGTAEVAGTLTVGNGGTGITSYTIGDLLYASGASTLSKLAAVASGSCLISQGTGTAPAWGSCGLTSEADTLATVTARGATTSSNLTFNGTLDVTKDVTYTFAGNDNLAINSDLNAGVNLIQVVGTPSATSGTTRGLFIQQADSANTNGLDIGIRIDNADTDMAVNTAIQIANSGGGGYTNILTAPSFTLDGTGTITAGTWNGTALTDAFVSNTLTASILIGSGSTTNAVDLGTAEVAGTLGVGNGGTGIASYTIGDLLYASGATTLSKLAAVASGSCLISQGTGTAPAWGACTSGSITGSGTSGQVSYFNGTGTITSNSNFTYNGTNLGFTGSGTLTVDTTGTINFGTSTAVQSINIATGGTGAKTLQVGSTASTSSTAIQAGTGTITIQNQGTGAISIANNAVNSTVNIGKTGTTGNTTSVNIATSTGAAQTVAAGSTNSGSTVSLQGGSMSLQVADTGITAQSSTNQTDAFTVRDSNGVRALKVDTTNDSAQLITNPSFEVNATGWSGKGSGSVSRQTSQVYSGVASGRITTAGVAGDGISYAYTFSASTQYTLSLYAKTTSLSITTLVIGRQDNGSDIDCLTGQTVDSSGWRRYTCTFTTGATISGSNIYIKRSDAASNSQIFVDAVRLETGANAGAYKESKVELTAAITSSLALQNTVDSTTAFQVQNSAGAVIFAVDTVTAGLSVGANTNFSTLKSTSDITLGTTVTTNNYSLPSGTIFSVTDTDGTAKTITGFTGGTNGRLITLINKTGSTLTLRSDDGSSSTAANRIYTGTGGTGTDVRSNGTIQLIYDSTDSRWRVIADSADTGCSNCANTSLSNLTTTSINQSLIPSASTKDLGSSGSRWGDIWGTTLNVSKNVNAGFVATLTNTNDNSGGGNPNILELSFSSLNCNDGVSPFLKSSNDFISLTESGGTYLGGITAVQDSTNCASGTHVAYKTNGSDYAEYFMADSNNKPEAAELVSFKTSTQNKVTERATNPSLPIIGAVSTKAGFVGNGPVCAAENEDECTGNYEDYNSLVALVGQIKVKVNNSTGTVQVGDPIGLSTTPGVGSKLVGSGYIVGYAMETLNGASGEVMVLIRPSYYTSPLGDILQGSGLNVDGDATITGNLSVGSDLNVSGATTLANLTVTGSATVQGSLTVVGNVETKNIKVNGHIITAGGVPTVTVGSGAGVAAGAINAPLVEVIGNDTSGTITITAGANGLADVLANIDFAQDFGNKPHVMLTAANRDATKLGIYYDQATATNSNVKLMTDNAPEAGKTYVFSYFIVE